MVADESEWIQQLAEDSLIKKDHTIGKLKHYLKFIPMEGLLEIGAQKPPKLYDF